MARDVFISYANEDAKRADRISELLEREGISCWIAPRDIPLGQDWPAAISEGIRRSHVLLLVLSANSKRSRHIPREVELADQKGLDVITFRLDDVSLPPSLEFFVANRQGIDASGDEFEPAVGRLIEAIRRSPKYPADLTVDSRDPDKIDQPWRQPTEGFIRRAVARLRSNSRFIKFSVASVILVLLCGSAYYYWYWLNTTVALQRGEEELRQGNVGASIADFDRVLRFTSSARVREDRAKAYHIQGSDDQALHDVDRALAIKSDDPALHLLKAEILEGLRRYPEALNEYNTVVDSHPDDQKVMDAAVQARNVLLDKRNVEAISKDWLSQMDSNDPPSLWKKIIPRRKQQLGTIRQRMFDRCEEMQDAKYTCYYDSLFDRAPLVKERVVLVKGNNGKWQVDGYGYK